MSPGDVWIPIRIIWKSCRWSISCRLGGQIPWYQIIIQWFWLAVPLWHWNLVGFLLCGSFPFEAEIAADWKRRDGKSLNRPLGTSNPQKWCGRQGFADWKWHEVAMLFNQGSCSGRTEQGSNTCVSAAASWPTSIQFMKFPINLIAFNVVCPWFFVSVMIQHPQSR